MWCGKYCMSVWWCLVDPLLPVCSIGCVAYFLFFLCYRLLDSSLGLLCHLFLSFYRTCYLGSDPTSPAFIAVLQLFWFDYSFLPFLFWYPLLLWTVLWLSLIHIFILIITFVEALLIGYNFVYLEKWSHTITCLLYTSRCV